MGLRYTLCSDDNFSPSLNSLDLVLRCFHRVSYTDNPHTVYLEVSGKYFDIKVINFNTLPWLGEGLRNIGNLSTTTRRYPHTDVKLQKKFSYDDASLNLSMKSIFVYTNTEGIKRIFQHERKKKGGGGPCEDIQGLHIGWQCDYVR
jgi:hypothetical protein